MQNISERIAVFTWGKICKMAIEQVTKQMEGDDMSRPFVEELNRHRKEIIQEVLSGSRFAKPIEHIKSVIDEVLVEVVGILKRKHPDGIPKAEFNKIARRTSKVILKMPWATQMRDCSQGPKPKVFRQHRRWPFASG